MNRLTDKNGYSLLQSHRYEEAVAAALDRLTKVPNDPAPMSVLAGAYTALAKYRKAMPYLEQLDAMERADPAAPGHPGQQMEIACLLWMLSERQVAIATVKKLVDGILDRSINYGDAAGGVSQGLLLYYMASTAKDVGSAEHALQYMKNRAKRRAIEVWPGPVARYYLHDVEFDFVLTAATGESSLHRAIESAGGNLRKRRDLCVALFHDGARHRVEGNEALCIERMRLCYSLENPIIENEWYLARYEIEQSVS